MTSVSDKSPYARGDIRNTESDLTTRHPSLRLPYLQVEDVADLLGCSKRTIHERARLGQIPHRRPPSARRLLFVESEIRAWLDGAALETVELPRGGRVVRPQA